MDLPYLQENSPHTQQHLLLLISTTLFQHKHISLVNMVLDIPKPGASFTEGITLLGLLFDRIQVSRTQDRDIVTFIQRYENLKVRFWQWGEAYVPS